MNFVQFLHAFILLEPRTIAGYIEPSGLSLWYLTCCIVVPWKFKMIHYFDNLLNSFVLIWLFIYLEKFGLGGESLWYYNWLFDIWFYCSLYTPFILLYSYFPFWYTPSLFLYTRITLSHSPRPDGCWYILKLCFSWFL